MRGFAILTTSVLLAWSAAIAGDARPPQKPTADLAPIAHLSIKSFRLTDNGDDDGIADPNETVNLYLTLRNGSGVLRTGIVVGIASNDPTVDCIPTSVVSFGSLAAGESRESAAPIVFHVADVVRTSVDTELSATLHVTITGDGFDVVPQEVTLDLDLDLAGGALPTTFSEGFEGAGLGSFSSMALDAGKTGPNVDSNGFRCQYSDPDFANSNSYGNTHCFLSDTGYDWHVHRSSSPDAGRAYLGNNSLHWGVHSGSPLVDTTRLKQLEAIRLTNPVNLGWNGVTSELSFKHQIGILGCDVPEELCSQGSTVDRAVVQVQLAGSSGLAVGAWRNISPYENVYDALSQDTLTNCIFDPTDDGHDEDDYFDPSDPARRLGPSSTCAPEFSFARQGAVGFDTLFDPEDIHQASDGPGLQGSLGPGTWVQTKFGLGRYRGRRLRLRFLTTSIELLDYVTVEHALGWNPTDADDGWYIDDIQVTNTLASSATVTVDTTDRSGLPNPFWYQDADQDGFGDPVHQLLVCDGSTPTGHVRDNTDCNDANPAVHPGVSDASCNGVDENCSGSSDENYVSQNISCGVGVCARSVLTSCVGGTVNTPPCVPGPPVSSTDTTCNGSDEDCSGTADEDYPSIHDQWYPIITIDAPTQRSRHTMVITNSGRIVVWGGGNSAAIFNTGGYYDPSGGFWGALNTNFAPTSRRDHRAVWTGTEMIVWGGEVATDSYLDTGGRWNPMFNQWTSSTATPGPIARSLHAQVWTGSVMLVWGGRVLGGQTNTGGRYTPISNSWTTVSTTSAPVARFNASAVWTGSRMIVWGGEAVGSPFNTVFNTGGVYDPVSNTWTATSTVGAPSARTRHTAVWTGSRMIVWGGWNANSTRFADGASYDPTTNTWSPIATVIAPAREGHVAVWDATDGVMVVWGGWNGTGVSNGARYEPTSDSWATLDLINAPAGARDAAAAWVPGDIGMMVWGGQVSPLTYSSSGARYAPSPFCGLGPCRRQGGTTCVNGTLVTGCSPGMAQAESCNTVDDDCDGTVDNHVGGDPGTPCVTASKSTSLLAATSLSWVPLPGATGYDVLRGSLGTLRSSAGDYSLATDACLGNDVSAFTINEPLDPMVSQGFWHLMRANFSGGPASYDETSPKQVGLRDAEIAASPNACP